MAFHSRAFDLVTDDNNGFRDVFVHDRETGITERVSVSPDGSQGDSFSFDPVISGDGRYLAFKSAAANLVPGDTNGVWDVFVHDRRTGATVRVSLASDGAEANGPSILSSMSDDGRFIAFRSDATNLVPGDTNGTSDVFVVTNPLFEPADTSIPAHGQPGSTGNESPAGALVSSRETGPASSPAGPDGAGCTAAAGLVKTISVSWLLLVLLLPGPIGRRLLPHVLASKMPPMFPKRNAQT